MACSVPVLRYPVLGHSFLWSGHQEFALDPDAGDVSSFF